MPTKVKYRPTFKMSAYCAYLQPYQIPVSPSVGFQWRRRQVFTIMMTFVLVQKHCTQRSQAHNDAVKIHIVEMS